MNKLEAPPIPLQEHHIWFGEHILSSHNWNAKKAAIAHAEGISDQGYVHSQKEKQILIKFFTIAYKAIVNENYTVIKDGNPDVICMGCFRNDGKCSIPVEVRDELKKTWNFKNNKLNE